MIPAVVGVIVALAVVVGLIKLVTGGGIDGYNTSLSELCASYSSAQQVFDSTEFDVTDELDRLARLAKDYDDSDVRDDGRRIDAMGGLISYSEFRSATGDIAAVC